MKYIYKKLQLQFVSLPKHVFFLFLVDYHSFQYFMQVVPTEVRTYKANMDTYQFAVTDNVSHNFIICINNIGLNSLLKCESFNSTTTLVLLALKFYMYLISQQSENMFFQNRPINHNEGSHGVPGIFVKYDLSPLLIRVKEVHRPLWLFLVELCGIIGGIFSASGKMYFKLKLLTSNYQMISNKIVIYSCLKIKTFLFYFQA